MSPLLAMRKALFATLIQDTALVTLLGDRKIYAVVPAATEPPYVSFGASRMMLWTGGSRMGHKHQIALDVWSRQSGDVEALIVADRMTELLTPAALKPDGLHVLHCYVEALTCHLPQENGWRQVTLDLSVLTEMQT